MSVSLPNLMKYQKNFSNSSRYQSNTFCSLKTIQQQVSFNEGSRLKQPKSEQLQIKSQQSKKKRLLRNSSQQLPKLVKKYRSMPPQYFRIEQLKSYLNPQNQREDYNKIKVFNQKEIIKKIILKSLKKIQFKKKSKQIQLIESKYQEWKPRKSNKQPKKIQKIGYSNDEATFFAQFRKNSSLLKISRNLNSQTY